MGWSGAPCGSPREHPGPPVSDSKETHTYEIKLAPWSPNFTVEQVQGMERWGPLHGEGRRLFQNCCRVNVGTHVA